MIMVLRAAQGQIWELVKGQLPGDRDESLARAGEQMTTAAMATYAYEQIERFEGEPFRAG